MPAATETSKALTTLDLAVAELTTDARERYLGSLHNLQKVTQANIDAVVNEQVFTWEQVAANEDLWNQMNEAANEAKDLLMAYLTVVATMETLKRKAKD